MTHSEPTPERLLRDLDADSVETVEHPIPGLRVSPAGIEEMRSTLAICAEESWRVQVLGQGSKRRWTLPAKSPAVLLSTRRMDRVLDHVPDDGTLTAEAGARPSDLAEQALGGGHHMTPDVPLSRFCSLGGVIAAAQSGHDRERFGSVREHVLGTTFMLADGTTAKSGGALVKNVTGYDLHRMLCGSHGTLAILLGASLRLFPAFERQVWLEVPVRDSIRAGMGATRIRKLPIQPVATVAWDHGEPHSPRSRWRLAVHLGGRGEVCDHDAELVRPLLEELGEVSTYLDDGARNRAETVRDLEGPTQVDLEVHTRPTRSVEVLERIHILARSARLSTTCIARPNLARLGVTFLGEGGQRVLDGTDSAAHRAVFGILAVLRRELGPQGGQTFLRCVPPPTPDGASALPDPFGEPTEALGMMTQLRDALDPDHRFALGRFHGGL